AGVKNAVRLDGGDSAERDAQQREEDDVPHDTLQESPIGSSAHRTAQPTIAVRYSTSNVSSAAGVVAMYRARAKSQFTPWHDAPAARMRSGPAMATAWPKSYEALKSVRRKP